MNWAIIKWRIQTQLAQLSTYALFEFFSKFRVQKDRTTSTFFFKIILLFYFQLSCQAYRNEMVLLLTIVPAAS